ncbi:MAG: hypothetical protein EXS48_01310 [Candidatus Staskawiczbacteria bacterium]|nr:hypothetical protein [Candidatus Staskawiczbacteria bacterium]
MKTGILIKNVIFVAVLLVVVFLSQQEQFKLVDHYVYKNAMSQINNYWVKTENWIKNIVMPKASREVSVIETSVTQEISRQKDNVVQNLWENFKNYFAEKFSKTFGTKVK